VTASRVSLTLAVDEKTRCSFVKLVHVDSLHAINKDVEISSYSSDSVVNELTMHCRASAVPGNLSPAESQLMEDNATPKGGTRY